MALLTTINQDILATSSTKVHELGDIYFHRGNTYVYAQAGDAITAYNFVMQTASVSLDVVLTGLSGAATTGHRYNGKDYAAGQVLYYATGGLTANQYAGYYLVSDDSTDTANEEGLVAIIETNSANHLYLDKALDATVNAADTDITIFHPWRVSPGTASTQVIPVGVSRIAVTDEYYFWLQTAGVAPVLMGEDTQTANLAVKVADAVAGTVSLIADGNDLFDVNIVGHLIAGSGTADNVCWVKLRLGQ